MTTNMKQFFEHDFPALLLRLAFGASMLVNHGLPKLMGYAEIMPQFPDPLGIGQNLSFCLILFAEFFCSLAVVLGIFTRLTAVPIAIAMAVAFFITHAGQAFSAREDAFLFAMAFTTIAFLGSGRVSLDYLLRKKA